MTIDLPDGWVIDPLAQTRLEHQLERTPAGTRGVIAPLTALPPGASYRSLAEHLALLPLDARRRLPADEDALPGARLVAPGAAGPGAGPAGPWVVDEGTAAHDPSAVDPELLVAHALGRSPFPRRPIVVLLGLETPDDVLEWARATTNALVGHEVEARLAVTRFPEGSHLTRPCLADARSLATLRPHVVVTLDDAATGVAEAWSRSWRATTLIELRADANEPIELHPLQIDRHPGRHRATIRTDVEPEALAGLVRRLAAGPQPGSPVPEASGSARPVPAPRRAAARFRPAARRSVTVATGLLDGSATARTDALVTALRLLGDTVVVADPTATSTSLEASDLVILRGRVADPGLLDVTARRRELGRPTLVDLGPDDLGPAGPGARSFGLAADVHPLVASCGLATSPSEAWCAELRATGVAAHRLPTPHLAADEHRVGADPLAAGPNGARIGWILAPAGPDAAATAAVAAALTDVVAGGRARLIVAGDPRSWPEPLLTLPGVTARPGEPVGPRLDGLSFLVWTPDPRLAEAMGTPGWALAAGLRHLPILAPHDGAGDALRHLAPECEVHRPDEPDAWSVAIDRLLDDEPAARSIAREARRRAEAATSPAGAERVAAELVTWAFSHAPRTPAPAEAGS